MQENNPQEQVRLLLAWMTERELIRKRKEAGCPKPWSTDPIFQTTYFCNVNRENDRVTRFIRATYSRYVDDPMFEVNIAFSRIINQPSTLEYAGYLKDESAIRNVGRLLAQRQQAGHRTFGDAYIVSTNGRAMPKAQYVAEMLLPALYEAVGPQGFMARYPTSGASCAARHALYTGIFGVASFMAGQFIGDLKNTPGHPLYEANDRFSFSCHGPGSLRGLSWIFHGDDSQPVKRTYDGDIWRVHDMLASLGCEIHYDMQDLQNCLCEFDKYMRIKNGTGRSKRRYPGC